jgi:cytochrome c6
MKKIIMWLGIGVLTMLCAGSAAFAEKAAKTPMGEAEFKEHCAMCHPDGGNLVNPKKTLHKKDLDSHGIKTDADIVKLIRKPGPGMNAFDAKTISDNEATEIAKYILKAFK